VARRLAALRGERLEAVERAVDSNFRRLFGLDQRALPAG